MIIQHLLEQQNEQVFHGGSIPGHIVINRDRENAHHRLYNDYFSDNPVYNEIMFRRRYRMSRSLFIRIVDAVKDHDRYFQQRWDNTSRLGLSPIQKITTAFRMLAYGVPADAIDEYIIIGESTVIESMKRFCRAMVEIFSEQYLRRPTSNDISRLLYVGQKRGFPGMLGSLDCMHWKWKNCPTAWAGQYTGRSGKPTIILETVANYDLWIWHAYFGLPGTNNDINVLESSHLFSDLTQGISPPVHYVIQGKEYNTGYYLADGIYPKWSTIVQTIHEPRGPKKKYFAMKQEACRKDVERAFGVLQSRFAIVAGPVRYWRKEVMHDIMTTCIILHNMIVEDERDLTAPIQIETETLSPEVEMVIDENTRFQDFISRYGKVRNREAHIELRNALIDHLWEEYTNSEN
ncbi:putative nuclease HARBI1 [Impatiens glandulifera]|uniref:putative nuclease HARBI1 n=1 Tax=Impatiens glandulifera TaxID=253017 RepID=UPI001FB04EED|nr:putative nuclease HARBI1 [Impatiens glandulifera]